VVDRYGTTEGSMDCGKNDLGDRRCMVQLSAPIGNGRHLYIVLDSTDT